MFFLSGSHTLLKVLECRCCTWSKKVLSSLRHALMAKCAAFWSSELSVILLGYPTVPRYKSAHWLTKFTTGKCTQPSRAPSTTCWRCLSWVASTHPSTWGSDLGEWQLSFMGWPQIVHKSGFHVQLCLKFISYD